MFNNKSLYKVMLSYVESWESIITPGNTVVWIDSIVKFLIYIHVFVLLWPHLPSYQKDFLVYHFL